MSAFVEEVDALLAVTGELLDEELIAATRELRDLAVEADDCDRRFRAGMAKVMGILESRIGGGS